MTLIAKNLTAGDLALSNLSAPDGKIPASGTVTLTDYNRLSAIQSDSELRGYIDANQVVFNDGVGDMSKAQSLLVMDGLKPYTVAGLTGLLGQAQTPALHSLGDAAHGPTTIAGLNAKLSDGSVDKTTDTRDPNAHKLSHQNTGSDQISLAGLAGESVTPQPPKVHGIGDAVHSAATVAGLNSKVSDGDLGKLTAVLPQDIDPDNASSAGTSIDAARADHQHATNFREQTAASEGQSTNGTATPSTKVTLTTPSIPAGTYIVEWSYEQSGDSSDKVYNYRVQVDGTTALHEIAVKQNGKYNDTPGIWYPHSGWGEIVLTAASHFIDLDFWATTNTAYIRRARLRIRRKF